MIEDMTKSRDLTPQLIVNELAMKCVSWRPRGYLAAADTALYGAAAQTFMEQERQ